jgi:hypothetical protein
MFGADITEGRVTMPAEAFMSYYVAAHQVDESNSVAFRNGESV